MKKIYFMRHGETDLNKRMRIQGRYDEPLNEKGIRQAEEAGRKIRAQNIRFHRVYSSPLQRAVQTALCVTGLSKEELILDDRIQEIDFGQYERKQFGDLPEEMWAFFRHPLECGAPDGMETLEELSRRTRSFLESLAVEADETEETWLVVCHGIAMRSILGNLTEDSLEEAWSASIENCVFYETTLSGGRYTKGTLVRFPEGDDRSEERT